MFSGLNQAFVKALMIQIGTGVKMENVSKKMTHSETLEWAKARAKPGEDVKVQACPHCTNWVAVYIDRDTTLAAAEPSPVVPPDLF